MHLSTMDAVSADGSRSHLTARSLAADGLGSGRGVGGGQVDSFRRRLSHNVTGNYTGNFSFPPYFGPGSNFSSPPMLFPLMGTVSTHTWPNSDPGIMRAVGGMYWSLTCFHEGMESFLPGMGTHTVVQEGLVPINNTMVILAAGSDCTLTMYSNPIAPVPEGMEGWGSHSLNPGWEGFGLFFPFSQGQMAVETFHVYDIGEGPAGVMAVRTTPGSSTTTASPSTTSDGGVKTCADGTTCAASESCYCTGGASASSRLRKRRRKLLFGAPSPHNAQCLCI